MDNNRIGPESRTNENKPGETDTGKIVRRHLEDEHDEITDEDIRNVRIADTDAEPVTTGAEAQTRFIDEKAGEDDDAPDPIDKPVTPWDVLDK